MMTRSFFPSAVVALLLATATLCTHPAVATPARAPGTTAPQSAAPEQPVVTTEQGRLAGRVDGRAEEFLGVPYAQPPVGERRFRPPARPGGWPGTRQAVRQAPACLQFSPFGLRDPDDVSEDCLYLDVYRPRQARPGDRRPVLFWIHGGAYSQGTGTQFGGRTMAELTGSVVVSINYRLGQLGYLAAPELARENRLGSGSYGLMDQVAALRWTHENIGAFGGDPAGITLWGQSAGSASVCALLVSPRTAGLFGRAVLQSGPCSLIRPPDTGRAAADAQEYATAAGCPDPATRAGCLRSLPAGALIGAAATRPTAGPAFGDGLVPVEPAAAISAGTWHKVPVLIGSTRSEGRFFVALSRPYLTAQEYADQVRATYGPLATQVLARYPVDARRSPYEALSQVLTDSGFACQTWLTARTFAAQAPTFVYEFDDPRSPTLYGAQVPGVDMANGHSAELAYLHDFTMADRPLDTGQAALADQMKRRWAAFARTGRPDVPGGVRWPVADGRGAVLVLDPAGSRAATDFAAEHQCAFWTGAAAGGLNQGARTLR